MIALERIFLWKKEKTKRPNKESAFCALVIFVFILPDTSQCIRLRHLIMSKKIIF